MAGQRIRREQRRDKENAEGDLFEIFHGNNGDSEHFSNERGSSTGLQEACPPRQLLPSLMPSGTSRQIVSPVSPSHPVAWSQYHKHCTTRGSTHLDWSNPKPINKLLGLRKENNISKPETLSSKDISNYLDNNKDFLDSYILEKISSQEMENWLFKKRLGGPSSSAQSNPSPRDRDDGASTSKQVFADLTKKLKGDAKEHTVVWELIRSISSTIGVDAYRVYKVVPDEPSVQYFMTDRTSPTPTSLVRVDPTDVGNVIQVARKGTSWRISRDRKTPFFPNTPVALFQCFGLTNVNQANHILYQPALTATGKTVYVLEMWRINKAFGEKDEEASSNILVWGSWVLHYCNLFLDKEKEHNMLNFLLHVVKAIFEEMVSLDKLIKSILKFAQKLVRADRASLFLVDYRNSELVSTVFDLKFDPGHGRDLGKKEIRMSINRGIAGHVALSGETLNISDAYTDYRFNREVDETTGYKTVNILCMPVKVQGKVIGVVQMVNKLEGQQFDRDDERAFEKFSTFFGLALHHARLYDKIIRKEQKYRVALEVLSYHNTSKEYELQQIQKDEDLVKVNIEDFYLDPYQLNEIEKCKTAIAMFHDLFGKENFDKTTLTRFILTVKKNYREVPYHNFDHGWSVAHAMYIILKKDQKLFDYKMRLSLFVACLCHDLDHRGYTNKYMSETASPLAAMYTTSTLEHHHFNITVKILQQDGHNIFSYFSSKEYKTILRYMRQCILATDLAVFFPNLEKLKQIQEGRSMRPRFDWNVPGHRDLAMAISMTAADLSASAKPWKVQIKTVKVIFEEFYGQGDKERASGKTPIAMMDRYKPDEQPSSQVGFLSQICVPCYSMLYQLMPHTMPMFKMAKKNLTGWKTRASRVSKRLEGAGDAAEYFSDSMLLQIFGGTEESIISDDGGKTDGEQAHGSDESNEVKD